MNNWVFGVLIILLIYQYFTWFVCLYSPPYGYTRLDVFLMLIPGYLYCRMIWHYGGVMIENFRRMTWK